MLNKQIKKTNTSGYKGVSWNKVCSKWSSRIFVNKRALHLGSFLTAEEAAKAYNNAIIDYSLEYATPNIILERK